MFFIKIMQNYAQVSCIIYCYKNGMDFLFNYLAWDLSCYWNSLYILNQRIPVFSIIPREVSVIMSSNTASPVFYYILLEF